MCHPEEQNSQVQLLQYLMEAERWLLQMVKVLLMCCKLTVYKLCCATNRINLLRSVGILCVLQLSSVLV